MGERTIVAMGGGGFSQEESPLLDDFVLSLVDAEEPRICFLAQAGGDSSDHYVTDSFGEELEGAEGLGFLPGTFCPHYDGEPKRRPGFARHVADGLAPGLACEDGVAAVFSDRELREVVGSRAGGCAYRVTSAGAEPVEARYLG